MVLCSICVCMDTKRLAPLRQLKFGKSWVWNKETNRNKKKTNHIFVFLFLFSHLPIFPFLHSSPSYFLSPLSHLHLIVFSPFLLPLSVLPLLLCFFVFYSCPFSFHVNFYLKSCFCFLFSLLTRFLLHLLFFAVLPLSLPPRSSRTAWTPMCPETGCCGIPYLVVSMHSPSTQLTLPSSLFTMPCWVSVDLIKWSNECGLISLDAVVMFHWHFLSRHDQFRNIYKTYRCEN